MQTFDNILYTNIIITLFFIYIIYKNKSNIFSFFSVFTIFYWLIMFSGVFLYYILYSNFNFDVLNLEYLQISLIYSFFGYIFFFLGYFVTKDLYRIRIPTRLTFTELKLVGYILVATSIIVTILYIYSHGGLQIFKGGNYNRFESNVGNGAMTILFPTFIMGLIILFLSKPTYKNWLSLLIIGLFISILLFLATGGGRMIVVLHTLTFLILAYHYKYIKLKSIILFTSFLIPLATLSAFFRSKMEFDDVVYQSLIFTFNTFSPFDSAVRIIEYYDKFNYSFEGFSVYINQLLALIPRILWEDKPLRLLNTGNFYTIEILNYDNIVTISPTLAGSFYISHGIIGIVIGFLITGIIIRILDNSFYNNPFRVNPYSKNRIISYIKNNKTYIKNKNELIIHLTLYYYILFNLYTLVRESLDVFLIRRVMIPIVILIIFLILLKIILNRR